MGEGGDWGERVVMRHPCQEILLSLECCAGFVLMGDGMGWDGMGWGQIQEGGGCNNGLILGFGM